ncbi:protein lin-37 homolog [Bombina bombina]|uniref:protein lin-37 homolog n=1 Tax=Bombina bombina TaxID=8345 RepID=UPI00235A9715|nr:protein lin-37 homolog [Bombina bombina]XP_053546138.1 protein lin-37 homolog [Bombina bombina]XP_053546139.1 protein lin-37 homolog [Bombina bombina]
MSLAKVKIEKTDLEAMSARNRLDTVLQGLLDKSDVDREQIEDEAGKSTDTQSKDLSPSAAGKRPSARLSHHRRKKRKEDDGITEGAQHKANTFIIRLFERSVDLAQFTEETPLYPVCRAWLRNSPAARATERPQTPPPPEEGEVNGNTQDFYRLPPPLSCPVTEKGEPVNLRIPSPLPRDGEPLNLNTPPELTPSMSSLIYQNMDRWKKIRQRWKDASYLNQQRYTQSMKILKEMYERQ